MSTQKAVENFVEVNTADLPFYCPPPGSSLWNAHPRVMIPLDKLGEARCPYCSTLYRLTGALPHGHH